MTITTGKSATTEVVEETTVSGTFTKTETTTNPDGTQTVTVTTTKNGTPDEDGAAAVSDVPLTDDLEAQKQVPFAAATPTSVTPVARTSNNSGQQVKYGNKDSAFAITILSCVVIAFVFTLLAIGFYPLIWVSLIVQIVAVVVNAVGYCQSNVRLHKGPAKGWFLASMIVNSVGLLMLIIAGIGILITYWIWFILAVAGIVLGSALVHTVRTNK